jgi:hypothetical protein
MGAATPTAFMFTTRLPCDELLMMVKTPVKVLTLGELNCNVNVAVCPGLRVAGTVPPETLKDDPVTGTLVIITGAVPVELRVRVWFALCPVWTSPKFTLLELTLNVGVASVGETAGDICKAKVLDALPALALSVAVCVVETEATEAMKPALVAFAATITDVGTVTDAILLDRCTANPPAGAAAVRPTVQASDPAPVIAALLHDTVLRVDPCVSPDEPELVCNPPHPARNSNPDSVAVILVRPSLLLEECFRNLYGEEICIRYPSPKAFERTRPELRKCSFPQREPCGYRELGFEDQDAAHDRNRS